VQVFYFKPTEKQWSGEITYVARDRLELLVRLASFCPAMHGQIYYPLGELPKMQSLLL
jgi:hypothetical protein